MSAAPIPPPAATEPDPQKVLQMIQDLLAHLGQSPIGVTELRFAQGLAQMKNDTVKELTSVITEAIGGLRKDIEAVQGDVVKIRGDVEKISKEVKEVRADVENLGKEMKEVRVDVENLGKEVKEMKEVREEIKGVREDIQKVRERMDYQFSLVPVLIHNATTGFDSKIRYPDWVKDLEKKLPESKEKIFTATAAECDSILQALGQTVNPNGRVDDKRFQIKTFLGITLFPRE
ncbi:hypothetical protein BDN72DRAFT_905576 [Pluteus cervinus]|uniref:Uncharacterized protein n=1 Tax=Pluteus cervinus TaxID=181527 RepID=A0ACD3A2H4_9AGAR|nr:hypothetical protein BDN72DRAFT_905576 [Pluteus cervinus]